MRSVRILNLSKLLFLLSAFFFTSFSSAFSLGSPMYIRGAIRASKVLRMSAKKDLPTTVEGWKTILSPNQFAVLRQKATEPPGFSERTPGELEFELKKNFGTKYPKEGVYECVGCGAPLYTAASKFDSGCGWPAYYEGIKGAIKELPDADGRRVEIVCNNCGSHLGHVFKGEGFPTPTDERHCVNGICLRYSPDNKA